MQKIKNCFNYSLLIGVLLTSNFSSYGQQEAEILPNGIVFPRLSTSERDDLTPVDGQFIYNSTTSVLNYYDGSQWLALAFSDFADSDGDTKIQVEESPDEDIIRMDAQGREVLRILADSSGRERVETENALFNTFLGISAGEKNTAGDYNAFYGYRSGEQNSTGGSNNFFGAFAGWMNTTGIHNAFFGTNAGANNTGGNRNCFFGESSGLLNTTGDFNSFYGLGSGEQNSTGESNSFYGGFAGQQTTTGQSNSFFGANSGVSNLTGFYNSFVGEGTGNTNKYGTGNTLIGSFTDIHSPIDSLLDYAIAIGYSAKVGCSNCAVIGGTGVDAVNVGIGISTPTVELDIDGDIHYTGEIMDVSDIRLKEKISPIDQPLERLAHLNGFIYNLIGDEERSAGLSAQDVQRALPEAVGKINEKHLGVDYTQIIALLVEAIKEQQLEIIELKEMVIEMKEGEK